MPEGGHLWAVEAGRVDPRRFREGRVGPYALGPLLRTTDIGDVSLALHAGNDQVVELERFSALEGTPLAAEDGQVLEGLGRVATLRHRFIAPIIGAGMDSSVPYVARPFRLGRTLAQAIDRGPAGPHVMPGILHCVADALAWLADQGPWPGACAMGGFDEQDVFLGFDGSIQLVGIGLGLVRGAVDPIEADCESLGRLLLRFGVSAGGATCADVARSLRRAHRDACGERSLRLAAWLRSRFGEAIQHEREAFGLTTIH